MHGTKSYEGNEMKQYEGYTQSCNFFYIFIYYCPIHAANLKVTILTNHFIIRLLLILGHFCTDQISCHSCST